MTFTYTLPLDTDLSKVRFLVQDIEEDGHRVEDEEITFSLDSSPNVFYAAAMVCDVLAVRYAARGRKSVGRLSIENSTIANDYAERAKALRAQGERATNGDGKGVEPWFGGASISEMDSTRQDTDRPEEYVQFDQDRAEFPVSRWG